MVLAWGWKWVVGSQETALRSFNIIWFGVTVFAMFYLSKLGFSRKLFLFSAVHPFCWYYLGEFRPYSMWIAGGSLLLLSAVLLFQHKATWIVWYTWAVFILVGSHLLGLIPVLSFTIYFYHQREYVKKSFRFFWAGINVFTLFFFSSFYFYKLINGAGGAKLWKVSAFNLIFSFYELLGFSGLGPGRTLLRETARSGVKNAFLQIIPHLLPIILLLCCYMVILYFAVKSNEIRENNFVFCTLIFVLLSAFLLTVLSNVYHWPFWGRHLSYLLPFLIFLVDFGYSRIKPSLLSRVLLVSLVSLLAISALNVRLNPSQARDDYRSAVSIAQSELTANGVVWWVSAPPFSYYAIKGKDDRPLNIDDSKVLFVIANASADFLNSLPKPTLVILSKPEVTDPQNTVGDFLSKSHFGQAGQISAFTLFRPSIIENGK